MKVRKKPTRRKAPIRQRVDYNSVEQCEREMSGWGEIHRRRRVEAHSY